MKGWHFCAEDRRLNYGDGRLIVAGETLTVDCNPVLCKSGLHASARAIDALEYAAGQVVSFVELRGTVVIGDNKAVATERHTFWIADASQVLRQFACQCALEVAHLWDVPTIVREYLETQDPEKHAAARDAARDAVWDAASAAARAAARAAAWDAARDAARAAASAAARDAAWDVARDAAWAAAWDVARDAAWDAQNADLEERLMVLAP